MHLAKWEASIAISFLKGAPECNFFLISFFFRVWIVASYVKVLKFVVAAIETKNR